MTEIIKLNVGGKVFITIKYTLMQSPWFKVFFSDKFKKPKKVDDQHFINRDPFIFSYVLNYLRDDKIVKFSSFEGNKNRFEYFKDECKYFCIDIDDDWGDLLYSNSKIIKFNVNGQVYCANKKTFSQLKWFKNYFSNKPKVINNDEYFINKNFIHFSGMLKYLKYNSDEQGKLLEQLSNK